MEEDMKTITIEWQRLVREGQTCDRCTDTGSATGAAVEKLRNCLSQIGVDVRLETKSLDPSTFEKAPAESNRIRIDGKTLEEWLDGTTGRSQCCGPCGDAGCRTVTVDGTTYETVPEELILRAGLVAAAEKLKQ